jgi:very-short-patch-repair endonuclease
MTLPEVILWRALRGKALQEFKFRRQHPVGPYVLDFYCPAHKLAVEVDGWSHNMGPLGRDERRDAHLAREGVRTLRLPATLVLQDLDGAIATIVGACARDRPAKSSLSRSDGEGDPEGVEGPREARNGGGN